MMMLPTPIDKNFLVLFLLFAIAFVFATRDVWRRNPRFTLFRKSKEHKTEEIRRENEKRLEIADEWIETIGRRTGEDRGGGIVDLNR